MSDWIDTLRAEAERTSQGRTGTKIGYSATVVSRVLAGDYRGDLGSVEASVRGALMGESVDCPVIGDLPRNRCIEHQRREFAATNPMRVQLYRACRGGCRHSRLEEIS